MILFSIFLNVTLTSMALIHNNLTDNSLKSLTLLATLKSNYDQVNNSLTKIKSSLQLEKNKIERRTNKLLTTEIFESNINLLNKNIDTTISLIEESFAKIKNRNYDQLINYVIQFIPNNNIKPTNIILLTLGRIFTVKELICITLKYKQLVSKEMTLMCISIKTYQEAMVIINTTMNNIITNDQIINSSNAELIEIIIKMTDLLKNNVDLSMEIISETQKLSEII